MPTPGELDTRTTLRAATARYDELRTRDAVGPPSVREDALEMLALGEVIARKAASGRQLGVRSARAAGASWSQIGDALGTTKQAAWEAHTRWIEDQAEQHRRTGYEGLDGGAADAARSLAGEVDDRTPRA